MSDTNNLYIKLVRNEKRESREQPMYVAPPNIEAQKNGKNWTIGAKIGDTWYNQCAVSYTHLTLPTILRV